MAAGLCYKGLTLNKQGKYAKAISVCEELDRRFGQDEVPEVRKAVVQGLCNKGLSLSMLKKSEEAVVVYDEIDTRFGLDESPGVREQVANALCGKGFALGELNKSDEAFTIYKEVGVRFGKDESSGVQKQVTNAGNSLAFRQMISAKQHWQDSLRKETLLTAIKGLESALLLCSDDARAMVSGNLGYALFLRGDRTAAMEPTRHCLKLGGETALSAQQEDAKLHRVEPEDSDYEALLTRLWAELHPATGPSGAGSQEDS